MFFEPSPKDSFLNVVKEKGLEEAIKNFEQATKSWDKDKEMSSKGLLVSNDGAYSEWAPFGPAIRGHYDDYGNISPAEDEDSINRVKILEALVGLPFDTIMEVAQDDRWFTLGLGEYANKKDWKPEGITKDMPEWQLILCKALSLTYFHAAVYDELCQFDFSAEEKDGVMKSSYDKKWKNEYLDKAKKKLPTVLKMLNKVKDDKDVLKQMELRHAMYDIESNIGIFRCLNGKMKKIYQACIAREECSLDWFYESMIFMYNMSSMCLVLRQSEYGSQHTNWWGWQRINNKLLPILKTELEDVEDEE